MGTNHSLFEQKFTTDMKFQSSFEKIKTFRVMDEDGNIVNNQGLEKLIDTDTLKKIFETMVLINEADRVFNQA